MVRLKSDATCRKHGIRPSFNRNISWGRRIDFSSVFGSYVGHLFRGEAFGPSVLFTANGLGSEDPSYIYGSSSSFVASFIGLIISRLTFFGSRRLTLVRLWLKTMCYFPD